MERTRVLHVYKSFNVYNGLIEILSILARNLNHQKYELAVAVYEYEDNDFGRQFEALGGRILRLNVPRGFLYEPWRMLSLYRVCRRYRPHIVQTHVLKANLYGGLAARAARVPVAIATEMTLKDTAPSRLRRARDRLIQPFAALAINRCDSFMVTSKYIRDQWLGPTDADRFEVVYPPFNLKKLEEVKWTPARDGGMRVCFVGRLSEEKGLPSLLGAMSRVHAYSPSTRVTIVGTGPLGSYLRERARAMGLNDIVRFAGYMSNSFEALAQSDIFVLPSRTEGCPIVILEAMAMGLPVVATDVGGNPELVTDGETGFLVPYNHPERMASAIVRLCKDRQLRRAMGRRGKEIAFTRFHPATFSSRVQSLYDRLLARSARETQHTGTGMRSAVPAAAKGAKG